MEEMLSLPFDTAWEKNQAASWDRPASSHLEAKFLSVYIDAVARLLIGGEMSSGTFKLFFVESSYQ